jgi:transcriptional regulator with XRE-family HTH domain
METTSEAPDVAGLLRELRQRAGWSQAALADRASTSQSAVARYETGAATPSLSTLQRLVAATGHHLHVTAAPAPDPADVHLAEQLLRMSPPDRLRTLARYAALRDRVEVTG